MNTRSIFRSTAAGLASVLTVTAARADAPGSMLSSWHGPWGWGHMAIGSIMMLLFWGAVVLAVMVVLRRRRGDTRSPEASDAASAGLAILEQRFARGEIDKDEFEDRKRTLTS